MYFWNVREPIWPKIEEDYEGYSDVEQRSMLFRRFEATEVTNVPDGNGKAGKLWDKN